MPVNFWNDPEFKAYGAAYFDKFEGKYNNNQIEILMRKVDSVFLHMT